MKIYVTLKEGETFVTLEELDKLSDNLYKWHELNLLFSGVNLEKQILYLEPINLEDYTG